MNTTSIFKGSALLLGIALLGVGCTDTDDFSACFQETPWNSCVNFFGIDQALVGDWTLVSEVVDAPGSTASNPEGIVTNPFSGRTTTFSIAERVDSTTGQTERYGAYAEDYSTETTPNVWTSSCDVLGTGGGAFRSEVDLDLDAYDPASGEPAPTVATLKVYPTGSSVEVTCQATGEAIQSNQASTPFGIGKGAMDSRGAHVPYTYEIDADWTRLVMTNENSITGVKLIYTFTKN